ncbi:hypothetical protein CALCODRAFT_301187 [Calocera cornea HHB12733]|uniref:Uncharacterized protein n=1 Tax=Calocera cornea HHB12733 TaxID=1353952 RepID=A0A165FHX5_9BASI|nr:hypothetical protein CALCODRAFT_301187 [Calocera cornea HHB12733]
MSPCGHPSLPSAPVLLFRPPSAVGRLPSAARRLPSSASALRPLAVLRLSTRARNLGFRSKTASSEYCNECTGAYCNNTHCNGNVCPMSSLLSAHDPPAARPSARVTSPASRHIAVRTGIGTPGSNSSSPPHPPRRRRAEAAHMPPRASGTPRAQRAHIDKPTPGSPDLRRCHTRRPPRCLTITTVFTCACSPSRCETAPS